MLAVSSGRVARVEPDPVRIGRASASYVGAGPRVRLWTSACIGDGAQQLRRRRGGRDAYYGTTALPATTLASLGLVVLIGGQGAVDSLMRRADRVLPGDAVSLLRGSLTRAVENERGGLVFVPIGVAVALWTTTGAMTAIMRGLTESTGSTRPEAGCASVRRRS
jgi:hypothetical protein